MMIFAAPPLTGRPWRSTSGAARHWRGAVTIAASVVCQAGGGGGPTKSRKDVMMPWTKKGVSGGGRGKEEKPRHSHLVLL